MDQSSLPSALVLVVPIVLLGTGLLVLRDARAREKAGRPVTFTLLAITLDDPATWAVLCVALIVVGLPLYLVARRAAG